MLHTWFTLQNDYTTYYRNHTDNFEHYTAEQKIFINDIILQAANLMKTWLATSENIIFKYSSELRPL